LEHYSQAGTRIELNTKALEIEANKKERKRGVLHDLLQGQ
jgi:hypothetical protein